MPNADACTHIKAHDSTSMHSSPRHSNCSGAMERNRKRIWLIAVVVGIYSATVLFGVCHIPLLLHPPGPAPGPAVVQTEQPKQALANNHGTEPPPSIEITLHRQIPPHSEIHCSHGNCYIRNACVDDSGSLLLVPPSAQAVAANQSDSFLTALQQEINQELSDRDRRGDGIVRFRYASDTIHHFDDDDAFPCRTAVLTNRYMENNCGHSLGDDGFPIPRLVKMFQQDRSDDQLPLVDDIWLQDLGNQTCDAVLRPLYRGHLYRPDLPPSNLPQCYHRIYFGSNNLHFVHGDRPRRRPTFNDDMRIFRQIYWDYANVSVAPTTSQPDTIVVYHKTSGVHRNNIGNRQELMDALRATFPSYDIVEATWTDYSLAEQMRLMARTKVMISLPGAAVLNAVFMPNGGYLFMYCRVMDFSVEASNDVPLWFQHLDYVTTVMADCSDTSLATYERRRRYTFVNITALTEQLRGVLL